VGIVSVRLNKEEERALSELVKLYGNKNQVFKAGVRLLYALYKAFGLGPDEVRLLSNVVKLAELGVASVVPCPVHDLDESLFLCEPQQVRDALRCRAELFSEPRNNDLVEAVRVPDIERVPPDSLKKFVEQERHYIHLSSVFRNLNAMRRTRLCGMTMLMSCFSTCQPSFLRASTSFRLQTFS